MRTQIRLQKLGHTPRKIAKSNGVLFLFVVIVKSKKNIAKN